jgi:hypothetical protein
LLEYGFTYDASHSATDYSPYYLRTGDRWSRTEAYEFGSPTELVAIPFSWGLDDFVLFEYNAPYCVAQKRPSEVRELWQEEFDYAHQEIPGGVFDLTMHPQVIGRGPRIRMLDELVTYMKAQDGVVFDRVRDYVDRWKRLNPVAEWTAENAWRLGLEPVEAPPR